MTTEEGRIKRKYRTAPPFKMIKSFIRELGILDAEFERNYSMVKGSLSRIKSGERGLPVKYWRFVYEKITPKPGYIFDINGKEIKIERKAKRPVQSVCIGIIERDKINPLRLQTEEDYGGNSNEKLVENYRGFNILKRRLHPEWYYAIQDSNLTLSSIPVARRCIDTYFNHLEMQANELSR